MTKWEWSARVLSAQGPESPTVRLVLLAVLSFYNDLQGRAWPGVESIAERSGHKSVRTVQDALAEADSTGWLRRDAKPGRVTFYFPCVPENRSMTMTPAKSAAPPPQKTTPTPAIRAGAPAKSAGELLKEEGTNKKEGAPPCPLCSAPMKKIDGKRGGFWGCSSWGKTKCAGKVALDPVEGRAEAIVATSRALSDKARRTRESFQRGPQAIGELARGLLPRTMADQAKPDTRIA